MRELDAVQVQEELDDLLDAVERGESIKIVRNGRVIARLLPHQQDEPVRVKSEA